MMAIEQNFSKSISVNSATKLVLQKIVTSQTAMPCRNTDLKPPALLAMHFPWFVHGELLHGLSAN